MSQNRLLMVGVILLSSVLFVACDVNKTSEQVTQEFWQALQAGDEKTVKVLSLQGSFDAELALPEITNIETGRIIIDADESSIETSLTIVDEASNKETVIETILRRQDKKWRVDYANTLAQLQKDDEVEVFIDSLQELTEQAADVLNESLDEMNEAIPEIRAEIERVEEQVKEALPEFREKLEGMLKNLEEALEKIPSPQEQEEQIEGTTVPEVEQHKI